MNADFVTIASPQPLQFRHFFHNIVRACQIAKSFGLPSHSFRQRQGSSTKIPSPICTAQFQGIRFRAHHLQPRYAARFARLDHTRHRPIRVDCGQDACKPLWKSRFPNWCCTILRSDCRSLGSFCLAACTVYFVLAFRQLDDDQSITKRTAYTHLGDSSNLLRESNVLG